MTNEHYKILKKILKGQNTYAVDITPTACEELHKLNLANRECTGINEDGELQYTEKVLLTSTGIEAVENKRRDNFRFWFPSIIAVLALAVSVITGVISILF